MSGKSDQFVPGDILDLERDSYQLVNLISTGSTCEVWKATTSTKQHVAVKLFKNIKADQITQIINEVLFYRDLPEHIKQLFVTFYDNGHTEQGGYALVMSLLDKDLSEINFSQFATECLVQLWLDLAIAVKYLHSQGYLHLDIKAGNILFDLQKRRFYLADFGTLTEEQYRNPSLSSGTPHWMAPEQFQPVKNENGQFTFELSPATDIHAIGLVMYFSLMSKLPASYCIETSSPSHKQRLKYGQLSVLEQTELHNKLCDLFPEVQGNLIRDLIQECMHPQPQHRPGDLTSLINELNTLQPDTKSSKENNTNTETAGEDTLESPQCSAEEDQGVTRDKDSLSARQKFPQWQVVSLFTASLLTIFYVLIPVPTTPSSKPALVETAQKQVNPTAIKEAQKWLAPKPQNETDIKETELELDQSLMAQAATIEKTELSSHKTNQTLNNLPNTTHTGLQQASTSTQEREKAVEINAVQAPVSVDPVHTETYPVHKTPPSSQKPTPTIRSEHHIIRAQRTKIVLAAYETTIGEYTLFAREQGRRIPRGVANHPVAGISVFEAQAYADWYSKKTGRTFRLPTEEEWLKAANPSNALKKYWWGDKEPTIDGEPVANVADLSFQRSERDHIFTNYKDGYPGLAPVGQLKANSKGLHDLAGNVAELTSTCITLKGKVNNNGNCRFYIVKGGSWTSGPRGASLSSRIPFASDSKSPAVGFRLAEVITQD